MFKHKMNIVIFSVEYVGDLWPEIWEKVKFAAITVDAIVRLFALQVSESSSLNTFHFVP